jgi:hypothetical protein
MKNYKLILSFIFGLFCFTEYSYSIELTPADCPRPTVNTGLESIFNLGDRLARATNQCDQIEIPDEFKKTPGEPDNSLSLSSIASCFEEVIENFFISIFDQAEGLYELGKQGVGFVYDEVKWRAKFAYAAVFGGYDEVLTEYLEEKAAFIDKIKEMLSQLPETIMGMITNEVSEWSCYNFEGKRSKFCSTVGYLGPEIVLMIVSGGASGLNSAARRAVNAIKSTIRKAKFPDIDFSRLKLVDSSEIRAKYKADLKALDNLDPATRKVIADDLRIGRDPKLATKLAGLEKKVLQLDDKLLKKRAQWEELLAKGGDRNLARAEKLEGEIRDLAQRAQKTSAYLGEIRAKKQLAELFDTGEIDIISFEKITPEKIGDLSQTYGSYNPGGTSYRVRTKKDLNICRGATGFTEAINSRPGGFFNFCKSSNYHSSKDNAALNATGDNNFDTFIRYEVPKDADLEITAVAPVYSADGLGGAHHYVRKGRANDARGVGGNVQVELFGKSRDLEKHQFVNGVGQVSEIKRVRAVAVVQSQSGRRLQSQIRALREKGSRFGLESLKKRIDSQAISQREKVILNHEIDNFLKGREGSASQITENLRQLCRKLGFGIPVDSQECDLAN